MRVLLLLAVLVGCGGANELPCDEDAGSLTGEWSVRFDQTGGECSAGVVGEEDVTYPDGVDRELYTLSGLFGGSCGSAYDAGEGGSLGAGWMTISDIHASPGVISGNFAVEFGGTCTGVVTATKKAGE